MFWWLMKKINFWLWPDWVASYLQRSGGWICTGEWGVQMPPLTSENSHFLRSGPQETTLVMWYRVPFFLKIFTCLTSRILQFFHLFIWNKEGKICSNPLAHLVSLLALSRQAVGDVVSPVISSHKCKISLVFWYAVGTTVINKILKIHDNIYLHLRE